MVTTLCPICGATLLEVIEERWSGKYGNVQEVTTFYLCEICGWEHDPMVEAIDDKDTHDDTDENR